MITNSYVKMYLQVERDGVGVMKAVLHLDVGCVKGKVAFTERNIKRWIIRVDKSQILRKIISSLFVLRARKMVSCSENASVKNRRIGRYDCTPRAKCLRNLSVARSKLTSSIFQLAIYTA